MSTPKGNALIGQSGGPTAVINQSLVGIVEAALEAKRIQRVYGALHGVRGVLEDKLIDLGKERRKTLEAVARTPGAALRSVRKKPTADECQQLLSKFQQHDVRYFFYIGGNDSAETAHLLNEMAQQAGYEMCLYHVPKTVDNDLRLTDHCPGYGSAAKFVAQALMGDNQDNRSLPGIKLDVIMGRNAGWLTAASVLARVEEGDGPHLVYLPERVFELDDFIADVDRVYKQLGRCVVALSEGVHGADGKLLVESKEKDSHGNVQLSGSGALGDYLAEQIKHKLGSKLRVRADTLGYLQRSFAGLVSEVDAEEARAVGREAVRHALKGKHASGSISIRRSRKKVYKASYARVELSGVAKVTRPMEEEFMAGSNDIAPAFLDYVRPLVGGLPRMARLEDHPLEPDTESEA